MGKKAKVLVHPNFKIGEISPRLYSAFLEPIGTMVNGTMYNPKHPTADDNGFRKDFMNAIKDSKVPAVRLPGGNFVSGWDWKDSIGPKEKRKTHLDLAWHQYITNEVGHDEYLQWAEDVETEPLYTINLGTGDINDAIYNIEYTNHEGGTYWSDLRKENGHKKPYGVKMWYLGNEMDGPWQVGSWEKDPRGYGIRVNEVSKAMKWVDPTIETAVCGSCSPFMAHYPQWDLDVMQECYEAVDYISVHHYHSAPEGDFAALLGGSYYYEECINTEAAMCDFVQAKMRSPKKMMISFDEYGTMMRPNKTEFKYGLGPHNMIDAHYNFDPTRTYIRHDPDNMKLGRRFEPGSEIMNALNNASILLAFLRHADRVKIACMTGGLGAISASDHDHVWKSASFYPFTQLMKYGQGTSMQTSVESETFDLPGYKIDDTSEYHSVEGLKFVDTAAAFDEESGNLNIFVINRNWNEDTPLELDVSGFEGYKFVEQIQLFSDDLNAKNTYENQDVIVPTINKDAVCKDGIVNTTLKKLSWNVFRFIK